MNDQMPKRWEPFRELLSLRDNLDRLFNSFLGRQDGQGIASAWMPVVDIEENDEAYLIHAELPGLRKEEIKVSIQGNSLTLSGERQQEQEAQGKTYHRLECAHGRFLRTISLPGDIDIGKVRAEYRNGILMVTLPKSARDKTREIAIEPHD